MLCQTLCDPMDCVTHQVPLSMGFPRQSYWNGLPFLSPRDLPNPYLLLGRWVLYYQEDFYAKIESCCCLVAKSCPALWDPMDPLSFTVSWSLLKLLSIESMMPSNHLILSCPLLLLPSIFPIIRVFSISQLFAKYWSFSFIFSPSNVYSEKIKAVLLCYLLAAGL